MDFTHEFAKHAHDELQRDLLPQLHCVFQQWRQVGRVVALLTGKAAYGGWPRCFRRGNDARLSLIGDCRERIKYEPMKLLSFSRGT